MRAATATILLAMLAGCTETAGTAVEVDDNFFAPEDLETTAGTALEFENAGQRNHTVTVHHPPDSATTFVLNVEIGPGETASFTPAEPGTYHVFCRFHGQFTSGMHMLLTVTE